MSMAVGKRIRFFRRLRSMTQKELGKAVGFSSRTASVRIAQYEIGARTPKPELLKQISDALNISADALTTPDLENVTLSAYLTGENTRPASCPAGSNSVLQSPVH